MVPVLDFGISQEDADVERSCLDIQPGDTLLCIASGGEVPLNILANTAVTINAVDTSLAQIYLSRLKWISCLTLEPNEGASFLGFLDADGASRVRWFQKAGELMSHQERAFWQSHLAMVKKGVIHAARFERYLSQFRVLALHFVGKSRLLKLMELDTVAEQQAYFDRHFKVAMLRRLFRFIFKPRRYRGGAISDQGFRTAGASSTADFFFARLRAFCTATLARRNYYLQFYFFNRVLFREALPDYLTDRGVLRIRQHRESVAFANLPYSAAVAQGPDGRYNKFHLSNISDWMSREDFDGLLQGIVAHARRPFRLLSRHLHGDLAIPERLRNTIAIEAWREEMLAAVDRFPFYKIAPIVSV